LYGMNQGDCPKNIIQQMITGSNKGPFVTTKPGRGRPWVCP